MAVLCFEGSIYIHLNLGYSIGKEEELSSCLSDQSVWLEQAVSFWQHARMYHTLHFL